MFRYLYCTFPVCISEYVSRNLHLCISEFPAMYLGIIPLLISNYSDIFIEIIPLLITEFLKVYKTCYYWLSNMLPLWCSGKSAEYKDNGQGLES